MQLADVAHGKGLEGLLNIALETGRMGRWTWDFERDFGEWSDSIYTLFALDRDRPINQDLFFSRVRKDYRELTQRSLGDALARKDASTHDEYPLDLPDGSVRWIEQRAMIDYTEAGRPLRAQGLCWDITERKFKERQSQMEKEEFEVSASRNLESLSRLSHEMKTPLHAILAMSQMMQDTELDAVQMRYMRIIENSGQCLLRLSEQGLQEAAISLKKSSKTETRSFDMPTLVRSCVSMVDLQQLEHGPQMSVKIEGAKRVEVTACEKRVEQLVLNLLTSLAELSEAEAVNVRLNGEMFEGYAEFELRVGVECGPVNCWERPATTSAHSCELSCRSELLSSLALSIAKRVMKHLGGKLRVCQAEDYPDVAVAYLKMPVSSGAKRFRPLKGAKNSEHQRLFGKRRRILIVEDNKVNQLIIKKYLAHRQFEVVIVGDGLEAVQTFHGSWNKRQPAHKPFDFIIMDIGMPVMSGHKATQLIRAFENEKSLEPAPIIALSASSTKADVDASLRAGADAFLSKPARKSDLLAKMAEFVGC